MSEELVRIEIVAPVHNRKPITLQCLKSLSRIDKGGLDVGIVIVDDGSTDGTGDAIREQFPDVDVIVGDGNLWFTEGTNAGIRRALTRDPKYLLLINDDAVFDGNFLRHMVETAERNPRSVVGSLLLLWDTPHLLFQTSPVWQTLSGGWRHWRSQTIWTIPARPWEVGLIVGNCVLVPSAAFAECGLMDSRRYPNFGDAEFTPRLRKRGWQLLIDPRARVFCQPNTVPPRVRSMGLKRLISDLVVDLKNTHNLRRLLYANLDSGPSKFQGFVAFVIFIFRAVFGNGSKRQPSGHAYVEKPLNETFAAAVIDD